MDSASRESCFNQHESTIPTADRQNTVASRSELDDHAKSVLKDNNGNKDVFKLPFHRMSHKRISRRLRALTHKPIFEGKEKPSRTFRTTCAFLRSRAKISKSHNSVDEMGSSANALSLTENEAKSTESFANLMEAGMEVGVEYESNLEHTHNLAHLHLDQVQNQVQERSQDSKVEIAQDLSQCYQKFLICEDNKNSISQNSFSDHTVTPLLANSLGMNEGATVTALLIECSRVLQYSYVCQEWMVKEKQMHFNLDLLDLQDKLAKQINHLTKMIEIIGRLEAQIGRDSSLSTKAIKEKAVALSRLWDNLPELTSKPPKNVYM